MKHLMLNITLTLEKHAYTHLSYLNLSGYKIKLIFNVEIKIVVRKTFLCQFFTLIYYYLCSTA